MPQSIYMSIVKPTFDWLMAFVILLMLSPVLLVISVSLFILGKSLIFSQLRPGLSEVPFEIYKFTSLSKEGESFPFGKFLRKSSLDELPQLVNILKGDMSFLGPRPLLMEYLENYTTEQHRRHLVKPGISGWAQVNGRKILSLEEKLTYDLEYVGEVSFRFDIRIGIMTIVQIFKWKESDESQQELKVLANES